MNIAFIGVGGVGGYFGGKMTRLMEDETVHVFYVARGNHYKKILENGLTLETKLEGTLHCKPTKVTDNIDSLPLLDLCFICVKQYDLDSVVKQLECKFTKSTKIIPLLNGIDIYDRIRAITNKGVILPACVYVGTHIKEPGIVEQNGGACTIIFGRDPREEEAEYTTICSLFDKAGIKYNYTEKYKEEIWSKYMFIAAYGLITASENMTLGQVYENKETSQKVKLIMKEILYINQTGSIGNTTAYMGTVQTMIYFFECSTAFNWKVTALCHITYCCCDTRQLSGNPESI
jgi:2-dehydropantoate 2-reductase